MHRAIRLAALLTTALAAPAFAQSIPVPPTRELIDDNGVDLLRGTYTVDETVASLGGSQGLALRRINRGSGWTNNVDAFLQSGANIFYATFNGRTDRFMESANVYTPTEANGASLTYNGTTKVYTYTARDGTLVTFGTANLSPTYNPYGNVAVVSAVVRPSGERLDYHYQRARYCEYFDGEFCASFVEVWRLATAKSAYGYAVQFSYASDELYDASTLGSWFAITNRTLVNTTVDYCGTTGCNLTQAWPSETSPNHLVNSYVTTANRVSGVKRPGSASNDINIGYDGSGRVASVADHSGSTSYAYADLTGNRTVTVTNSLSEVSTYIFHISSERLTKYKDPLNNETNYTYDTSARLTRITKPEGNYTNYTYDARGNVTEVRNVAKPGSGIADIVATAVFPATCTNAKTCNQPTSTTDARGKVTDYTYSSTHGGVLTITAPAPTTGAVRPKQTFTYVSQQAQVKSSSGGIITTGISITLPQKVAQCATLASCANGADEVKSVVTYGANGVANNLLPTQVASGNGTGTLTATRLFAYDMIGNLVTVDGPLTGTADTTTALYDSKRRAIGTVSPDPDGAGGRPRLASRTTFATNGDTTKIEIGTVTGTSLTDLNAMTVAQATDMSYDADGRKLTDTLTGGGSSHALSQYSYDSEGRLTCAALRMNPAAWGSLPPSACTLGTAGGFGPDRITKTLRDANGRATQVQVALGTADQANERTLAYTSNGALAHLIDANDNRTTYEYDGHDRLVKTRFPLPAIGSNSSSTTDYEQLTLDAGGNVTTRRLRDGQSIGYTYDALNRLTNKNLPGTEPDATYSYDLLGRMTSAVQNGITNAMTWDALGRKLTETAPQGTVSSQYDLANRRTRVTLPGTTSLFADYVYDLLGNVTFIKENGATSGVGVLATYQYDSLSRRSSVTFGNGVVQGNSYDNAARLATQTNDLASTANDLTQTFAYNPASQIGSVTRSNDLYAWTGHTNQNDSSTPNGLNQIGNVGAKTVTHDSKGNITGVGTDSYVYSSENFLTSGPAGTALSYDPMGRLYQVASGASTTRLGYDGLDRIAEYDGANAVQRRYIHGPGIDEPVTWYEGSVTTSRRFLSTDERGSIISLTDSSGTPLNINKYDEYGIPQNTNLGKFGYTGQAWVPEIKLWYYKARFYNPIGRFMQTDPIGYGSGPNLYAYVRNDPISHNDPLGLWCQLWRRDVYLKSPDGTPVGDPISSSTFTRGDCSFGPRLGSGGQGDGGDLESSGDAYEDETPEEQEENCSENLAIHRALGDRDVQWSIDRAISLSLSRSSLWEYGFWSSESHGSGDVATWGVGTSRSSRSLNPFAWGIRPWFFEPWLSGTGQPNIIWHTHIPGSALSQPDVNFANRYGVSIVAITDNRTLYCYPGR